MHQDGEVWEPKILNILILARFMSQPLNAYCITIIFTSLLFLAGKKPNLKTKLSLNMPVINQDSVV